MLEKRRFLIVDGYPKEERVKLEQAGMKLSAVLYEELLKRHFPLCQIDTSFLSDSESEVPSDDVIQGYAALLWTGCSLTVYHHEDVRVQKHLRLADRAFELGVPGFGSCWALQLAATVAGGKVQAHPKGREMGIGRKIELTDRGRFHPFYEGKPDVFDGFVSHDDEVIKLPPGAILLATNSHCIQAAEIRYKKGIFFGVQYHPEYNLHELARLIVAREEKLIRLGFFKSVKDAKAMVNDMEVLYKEPDRKDLRWKLGIDDHILVDAIREKEFANWIKYQVIANSAVTPFRRKRAG